MGRRRSTRRVASDEVQGEGSWVEVQEISYGEYKAMMKAGRENTIREDLDDEVIREHVAAWNWVDDDDNPLPLPRVAPSIIDALTVREKGFLITAIFQVEPEKN